MESLLLSPSFWNAISSHYLPSSSLFVTFLPYLLVFLQEGFAILDIHRCIYISVSPLCKK